MADESLVKISKVFAYDAETADAQQNVFDAALENGDKYARGMQMATFLDEPVPQDKDSYDTVERRYASAMAANYFGSPMVRRLFADRNYAKLIADSPREWEELSAWDKAVGAGVESGWLQRGYGQAVADAIQRGEETPSLLSRYSVDDADMQAAAALGVNYEALLNRAAATGNTVLAAQAEQLRTETEERNRKIEKEREDAIYELAELEYQMGRQPRNRAMEEFANAEGVLDSLSLIAQNPLALGAYVAGQSVGQMAPELAGAALAGGLGIPVLAAGLVGKGSFNAEYGATYLDTFREAGVDIMNPDAVREAMRDPELSHRAEQRALGRALVVAGFDTLAAGLASFKISPVTRALAMRRMSRALPAKGVPAATASRFAAAQLAGRAVGPVASRGEMENLVWQALAGSVTGGAGEALGSLAIGDEVSIPDVVMEAVADMFTAPVEVVSLRARTLRLATEERGRAVTALQNDQILTRLEELQDKSVLNRRAPETFEQQIQTSVTGTDKAQVVFSASEMRGFAQAAVQASPEIARQWRMAEATGGDVTIPLGELARIRRTAPEVYGQLKPIARFGSDAMSVTEARDFAKNFAPTLEQSVNDLVQRGGQAEANRIQGRTQAAAALEPLREQLRAAGRSDEEINSALALEAAILDNVAEMTGMTPQEWIEANPLNVQAGEGAQREGFSQSAKAERRNGDRGFFDPKTGTVTLFNSADQSTFIHEAAHYWLNSITTLASRVAGERPNAQIVQLADGFLRWLTGADKDTSTQELLSRWQSMSVDQQRKAHEKFAKGFESYLLTGRAPESSLATLFRKFSDWLKRCYVHAAPLGVEMSPEVIALYDRLFVSEEVVTEARERMSGIGVFDDLVRAGMTDEEFRGFADLRAAAVEQAEAKVRSAMERDALAGKSRREREARNLEKEYEGYVSEAERAIESQDSFRALRAFQKDGIVGDGGIRQSFRFDVSLLEENLTPENAEWVRSRKLTAAKPKEGSYGIADPKYAAKLFGFESPDALVNAMREADDTDVSAVAEAQAQERFKREHGEAYSPDDVERLASIATQEAMSLDVLATELAALKGAMGRRNELRKAVKTFARSAVARMRLMEDGTGRRGQRTEHLLSARPYRDAARRAARKAEERFRKGDTAGAADAKQAELIQTAIAAEIEAARAEAARFRTKTRKALRSKTVDSRYSVQLHKIANALGFAGAKSFEQEPSFSSFVKRSPEVAAAWHALPETFIRDGELRVPPLGEQTIGEFRALASLTDVLEKAGRLAERERKQTRKDWAADALTKGGASVDAAMARLGRKVFDNQGRHKFGAKAFEAVRRFFMGHIRALNFLQILDGNKQGFWTQTLGWRANECAEREGVLTEHFARKLNDIMRPFYRGMNREIGTVGGRRVTKQEALATVLNAGNEGNRERLRNGNNISETEIREAARLLTQEELNRVQQIWDLFEELRQVAAEKARRVDGFEPEWIQPMAITLDASDGTVDLKGGYYPIAYDPEGSAQASFWEAKEVADKAKAAGYLAATTSHTYTKARTETGLEGAPLKLNFNALFDGLTEVIHDVSWSEFVTDANYLLRGVNIKPEGAEESVHIPGLNELAFKYFGNAGANILRDWVAYIAMNGATPGRNNAASDFAAKFRQGVSIAGLGFNFTSGLVQLTGLLSSVSRVGPAGLLKGLGSMLANPRQMRREINAMSETMRQRTNTRLREIHEVRNAFNQQSEARARMEQLAYGWMMTVQAVVDYATWEAAFEQGLAKGLSQAAAVKYADQEVINTQGSGTMKDRSSVEQGGPLAQIFLSFYSYMGTAFNLGAMSMLGEADLKKRIAAIGAVFFIQPVVEQLMRDAMKIGDDKDNDDDSVFGAVRYCAGASVNFTLGTMFGIREIADAVGSYVSGDPVYTWRGPSGLRLIPDFVQFLGQLAQVEKDGTKALDEQFGRAALNVAGVPLKAPTAQLWRIWTGWNAYFLEEETDNPLSLVLGYSSRK